MSEKPTGGFQFRRVVLYAFLAVAAIALPPLLYAKKLPFVDRAYGHDLPYVLLGFSAGAAILIITYLEIRRRKDQGLEGILPVALTSLVSFHYLLWVSEAKSLGDFTGIYRPAVDKLMQGQNPYEGTGFLYSPMVGQTLAACFRFMQSGVTMAHLHMSHKDIWGIVFYFMECAQIALVVAAFALSVRMVRLLGARDMWGLLIVAAVFVFNNPLVRTIRWGQVNLWMLDAMLFALVIRGRLAWLGGLFVAIGANMKLYPLAVLPPLAIVRRWKEVAFSLLGIGVVLMLTTDMGRNWLMWRQYLHAVATCPTNFAFRNNALRNFLDLGWHFTIGRHSALAAARPMMLSILILGATLAFVIWIVARIVRRERCYGQAAKAARDPESLALADNVRLFGHATDVIGLSLIVSPMVWEHHYALAIPVILYAFAVYFKNQPWLVSLGAALILLPPTFDFYPFSFHRLAGLILLLVATAPRLDLAEYRANGVEMAQRAAVPELVES